MSGPSGPSDYHNCPCCCCRYAYPLEVRRHQIMRGLIGDRWDLFHTSAEFHAWVYLQSESFVQQSDFIATMAEAQIRDTKRRVQEEMHKPIDRRFIPMGGKD